VLQFNLNFEIDQRLLKKQR